MQDFDIFNTTKYQHTTVNDTLQYYAISKLYSSVNPYTRSLNLKNKQLQILLESLSEEKEGTAVYRKEETRVPSLKTRGRRKKCP